MAITWEDPSTKGRGLSGAWTEEADQLRAHPERWGVVAVYGSEEDRGRARSLCSSIRSAGYAVFRPKGSFESAIRKQPDGSHKVYARYIGDRVKN